MQNVGKCLFIIIGTLIGAGFASGQEIATFFNRFGEEGLCGNILASILFGMVIVFVLFAIDKKKINAYDDLIGRNKLLKFIIEMFLFVCFCIMIAGVGAFFEQQLKVSHWLGASIGASICYLIFSYKYKGIEILNTLLVPFIILGIIMIGFGKYDTTIFDNIKYTLPTTFITSPILSSVLYVSYNSLILVPILITFKQYNLCRYQKWVVAILSSLIFGMLGVVLFKVMNIFFPEILVFQLPTLRLAEVLSIEAKIFYGIIILFAIFTTAISSGYAFLEMKENKYMLRATIMCVASIFLSKIGFSTLVNIMFPFFGYLGLLQLMIILYAVFKKKGVTNDKR